MLKIIWIYWIAPLVLLLKLSELIEHIYIKLYWTVKCSWSCFDFVKQMAPKKSKGKKKLVDEHAYKWFPPAPPIEFTFNQQKLWDDDR